MIYIKVEYLFREGNLRQGLSRQRRNKRVAPEVDVFSAYGT